MTAETDLLLEPCPFCGGEAKRDDRTEYQSYSASESQSMGMGVSAGGFSSTTYAIQCDCGIRVQGNNDAFLIARWNRRTALTPPAGGLPELPEPFMDLHRDLTPVIYDAWAAQLREYAIQAVRQAANAIFAEGWYLACDWLERDDLKFDVD